MCAYIKLNDENHRKGERFPRGISRVVVEKKTLAINIGVSAREKEKVAPFVVICEMKGGGIAKIIPIKYVLLPS